jgi:hypothetical protein
MNVRQNDVPQNVEQALELYLEEIGKSRASSTLNTYHYIVEKFICVPLNRPLSAAI